MSKTGIVKFWIANRGYGFVTIDGKDAMLHTDVLRRVGLATVMPGDRLEVELAEGEGAGRVAAVLHYRPVRDNAAERCAKAIEARLNGGDAGETAGLRRAVEICRKLAQEGMRA